MPELTDEQCNAIAEMVPLTFTQAENTRALIRLGHLAAQGPMNASGAVYLLLAELTGRNDLPPIGAKHDAAPWAEIAKEFCEKHGLTEVPRWPGSTTPS